MSEMTEEQARDEIRACVALCGDCDHVDRKCHEFEKGFLAGIAAERKIKDAMILQLQNADIDLTKQIETLRKALSEERALCDRLAAELSLYHEIKKHGCDETCGTRTTIEAHRKAREGKEGLK